jgi:ribosome-associated protein
LVSFAGLQQYKTQKYLMAKRKKESTAHSEKLSKLIVKGMQEKKASDIVVMDLRKVKNAVADFFVLCSGNSDKQLDAIAHSIDEEVHKALKENPWHTEGKNNKEWMLLDYINVVAHVFRKDKRTFFALEKLWGDAEITEIED